MRRRVAVIIILFWINTGFSQQIINFSSVVHYQKYADNLNSDFQFYPEKGFKDPSTKQMYFQSEFDFGSYEILSFEFKEEPVEVNSKTYNSFDYDENYQISFINQEENNKIKKTQLLLSCIRTVDGKNYRVTQFNASVKKTQPTQRSKKSSEFASQSILSNGWNWFKLGIYHSGLYKIDYSYLINHGIINGPTPSSQLHLFSNNQGLLNTENGTYRPDDLIQQTLHIVDGNDGSFSSGDYILFYHHGSDRIEKVNGKYRHINHLYSDSSYCFFGIGTGATNVIDSVNNLNQNYNQEINEFWDFEYINEDKLNLLKSGAIWLGDVYDLTNQYTYDFPFSNLSDSSFLKLRVVSKSSSTPASFNLSLFGQNRTITINGSGSSYLSDAGRAAVFEYPFVNNVNSNYQIDLTYNNNGSPSAKGYLDYIEVNCKRQLIVDNSSFDFKLSSINSVWSKINLQNSNSVQMIWDITTLNNVKNLVFERVGNNLFFKDEIDSLKNYIAISGNSFPYPTFVKRVESQNLHGLSSADVIIIINSKFSQSASMLKTFHEQEGLSVHVVTDQQIYNEFSSGMRDATALKQFLRMFYVRGSGIPNQIPKYCVLLGDGTYDNRNILDHGNNLLPVFESQESLSKVNTFATDDFFAILSDGASMRNTDLLNIAIGRLSVSTEQEAMDVVQKIIEYQTIDTLDLSPDCDINPSNGILGDWRNKVILVSDDEDQNAYFNDIEIMASKIEQTKPTQNIIKIHADAYAQQPSAVGERIPDAELAINQRVNDGALLVNYIGHGGETGWAHEQILKVPTIQNWSNISNMPVFMTATCEFGRFDDHDRVSAGEYVLLNPNGGGVGLYTTTRLVYATPNEWLNRYFYDTVFDLVNYKAQRLGDIYKGTKNKFALNSADQNYRKFALLGDPALKLALPEIHVILDSTSTDTIRALDELVIYGHIEDENYLPYSNFNGIVNISLFDKKTSFSTLGTNSGSSASPFQMWKSLIYKGKSTVSNGQFIFRLKVPKDIDYSFGSSRISFYVENGQIDGNGSDENLIIGGINTNATSDEVGPDVKLYMNDMNFVSGGISNSNPVLIAHIFDSNGINTVGNGIGHDIELILDGDYANSIILNEYYESDLDSYQSGKIFYELTDLSAGEHQVELKVWDNYNNSSKSDISFTVVDNEEIRLNHVLNYPNPFTTNTSFFFEHNQNCNYLDVDIHIYNVSGKIVKTINRRIHNEGFRSSGISWDGLDDFGEQLARGVYLYKLKVTNEQGLSSSKTETMFLLK